MTWPFQPLAPAAELIASETVAVTPTEATLYIVGEQPNIFAIRGTAVIQPGRRLVAFTRRRYRRWPKTGLYNVRYALDTGFAGLVMADMQTTQLLIVGEQPTVTTSTGSGPTYVTPTEGLLVIQGQTPTPTILALCLPTEATLALQGQQPAIAIRAFPTEAVLLINGQQPSVSGTTSGPTTVTPTEATLYLVGEQPTLALQGVPVAPTPEAEQGGGARTDMARYTKRLRQQKALMMVIEEFLKHAA